MPFLRPTRDRTPELLGEAIGKRTGHTYYLEDYQLREGILLRVWSPDLKVVGHVNAWERGDTGAIVTPKVAAQLPVYMSDIRIEQECREEGLARARRRLPHPRCEERRKSRREADARRQAPRTHLPGARLRRLFALARVENVRVSQGAQDTLQGISVKNAFATIIRWFHFQIIK